MENYEQHIKNTTDFIKGEGLEELLSIPNEYKGEIARGTAILDCYTNFYLNKNKINTKCPSTDDSYAFLDAYVYGAIQLADTFGTEDFYNYYDAWVNKVIIPAIMICNKEND